MKYNTLLLLTLYIVFLPLFRILAQETVRKNMRFYRFYVLLIAN